MSPLQPEGLAVSSRGWSKPATGERHPRFAAFVLRTLKGCHVLAIALTLLFAPALSRAQDDPPEKPTTRSTAEDRDRKIIDLQSRTTRAIQKGDLPEAERLIRECITLDPKNFVHHYNLACTLALLKEPDEAVEALKRAIETGFVDLYRLRSDPDFRGLREHAGFKTIVGAWPEILLQQLKSNLEHAKRIFSIGKYETTRDETLRIAILSAMDPTSTKQAHADITRLYQWSLTAVFPELADESKAQHDAWAVVVLPSQRDFRKWAVASYGLDAIEGTSGIGGHYNHDEKRLVSMDLGSSFRHEFFHVLHWRSTTRLGQDHPIWIQEGLCSLVEDYELGDPSKPETLKPVASWRSNIVKRLASGGRLLTIKQLAAIRRDRFTGTNPLAHYAQARTVFLYLAQSGKLKDWYAHYTTPANYRADPTGVKSIEAIFGKPIAEIDRDYRAWVKTLPEVAEQTRPGDVSMGADVEAGDGDGPVIVDIPRDQRNRPNPARKAGLRKGDVITAVDGQPTRDLNELVRVLGTHAPGDTVEIAYRRGKTHATARVVLEPR